MKMGIFWCGSTFLLLTILLAGCKKEEVNNVPFMEATINNEPLYPSLKTSQIRFLYKINDETSDSSLDFIESSFRINFGDAYAVIELVQENSPPGVYLGEYEDFMTVGGGSYKFCSIEYHNKSGVFHSRRSRCILQSLNEDLLRLSLSFDGVLFQQNDSINLKGRLLNIPYKYLKEKH